MPSTPPGSLVIDSSVLYKLSPTELEMLARIAVSEQALIVEAPAIVSAETPLGPMLLSIGTGSLVFSRTVDLRLTHVGPIRLRSREWIDACRVSGFAEPIAPEGGYQHLEGRVIAVDYRDPIALLFNGLHARLEASPEPLDGEVPVATLERPDGPLLLGRLPDGRYVLHFRGDLAEVARVLAGLRGGCGG